MPRLSEISCQISWDSGCDCLVEKLTAQNIDNIYMQYMMCGGPSLSLFA